MNPMSQESAEGAGGTVGLPVSQFGRLDSPAGSDVHFGSDGCCSLSSCLRGHLPEVTTRVQLSFLTAWQLCFKRECLGKEVSRANTPRELGKSLITDLGRHSITYAIPVEAVTSLSRVRLKKRECGQTPLLDDDQRTCRRALKLSSVSVLGGVNRKKVKCDE